MKETPILFSGPMIRAILEDRKTVTRRIVKPQPTGLHYLQTMWGTSPPPDPVEFGEKWLWREVGPDYPDDASDDRRCPYGVPGDRLWVKETHCARYFADGRPGYRADYDKTRVGDVVPEPKWTPSIYMPRSLSRITLEVTEVRVERLQEITISDAVAEGIELPKVRDLCRCQMDVEDPGPHAPTCPWRSLDFDPMEDARVVEYAHLWNEINGKKVPWSSNPFVWVVSFRRVT